MQENSLHYFQIVCLWLAVGVLGTLVGAVIGVMYALKGDWRAYIERVAPPTVDLQLRFILKQCVQRGIMTQQQMSQVELAIWEQGKVDTDAWQWVQKTTPSLADRVLERQDTYSGVEG